MAPNTIEVRSAYRTKVFDIPADQTHHKTLERARRYCRELRTNGVSASVYIPVAGRWS